MRSRARRAGREEGAALVTAMLIAALAVIALAGLFDQQAVMMRQVESGQLLARARLLQDSCLAWAAAALEQEGIGAAPDGGRRVLDCPRGIVEPHGLDAGTAPEPAGSSETIDDLQGRFNLRNLVRGGEIVPEQLHAFERLLAVLRLDLSLAQKLAHGLAQGRMPASGSLTGQELAVLTPLNGGQAGRLARFLVLLPQATPLNVNSAAPEILAAISTMSLAQARTLAASRSRVPFRDTAEFTLRLGQSETLEGVSFTAQSTFFTVVARTRIGRVLVARHLLAVRDVRTGRFAYRDALLDSTY